MVRKISLLTLSMSGFWQYGSPDRHGASRDLCWFPSHSLHRPQLPQMRFGKKLNNPAPIDELTKVSGRTFIFFSFFICCYKKLSVKGEWNPLKISGSKSDFSRWCYSIVWFVWVIRLYMVAKATSRFSLSEGSPPPPRRTQHSFTIPPP